MLRSKIYFSFRNLCKASVFKSNFGCFSLFNLTFIQCIRKKAVSVYSRIWTGHDIVLTK